MGSVVGADAETAQATIDQAGEELPAALVMLPAPASAHTACHATNSAKGVAVEAVRRLQR